MRYIFGLALVMGCSDKNVRTFNDNPEVSITSHQNGDVVNEGYVIEFRAALTDSNHDTNELEAAWYVNGNEVCPFLPPDGNGDSTCATTLSEPETGVRVEVRDPQNAVGKDVISLTVTQTDPPVAEIIGPDSDDILYSDLLITFEGLVSDAEDNPEDLSVAWESNLDGVLDLEGAPDQNGVLTAFGQLSEGQHGLTLTVTDLTGKIGTDSVTVTVGPPNTAPNCAIQSPSDQSVFLLGDTVTFTAESSDVDIPADLLSVRWVSDKDGEIGNSTPNSDGTITFPYAQLSANTHVISMTVQDELEATCTDSVVLTIGTPPTVTISSPTGGQRFNDGDGITFTAEVSDAEDPETDLILSWESSIDGVFSTNGADSNGLSTFNDTTRTVGNHTLTLSVTDSAGLEATAVETFIVNGIPSAPFVNIAPVPANTNDSLTATASGSIDVENDPITYSIEWFQNGNPTTFTGSVLPDSATLKGETWTARATPNDGYVDGPFGEGSITIQNSPPTISGLSISPSIGITNTTTLVCSATVTDADVSDTPSESYSWSINGNPAGTGTSITLDNSLATPGDTITCQLSVDDLDGGVTTDSTSVTVDNTAPVVNDVTITPDSGVTPTETVTCVVTCSDADGDPTTDTFVWTNDSTGQQIGTSASLMLDNSMVSSGDTLTCTATVTDPHGAFAVGSDSIVIVNPPTVNITAPLTGSVINEGDSIQFEALVSDPEDLATDLVLLWESDIDGILDTNSADSTGLASFSNSSLSLGTHTIGLTATDSDGLNSSDGISLTINGLPTAPTVSITPDPSYTTDALTANASGSTDPENQSISYNYAWELNGVPTSYTSQTVPSSATNKGDVWTVRVTPNDGYGDGPSGAASITIQNSPPVISSVTITPSSGVTTSTALTCSETSSDADNDSLTIVFEWDIDGASAGTGSTLTLTPSIASPNSVVTCTVTAEDGTDSSTDSASVNVDNSPPIVNTVTLTPDPAYTDDTMVATASGSDSDNQTVALTYEWLVNGTPIQNGGSNTLDGTLFVKGDSVSVSVTPNDGIDDGLPVSAGPITIQNSSPSQPSLQIIPSAPVEGVDDLICDITLASVDADLDVVTYTFTWTQNGSPYTSATTTTFAGDTVQASATGPNDLWECTVVPNDGSIDGPFDSVSVTIEPIFDGTATSTSVDTLPEPAVDLLTMFDPAEERILVYGGESYYQLLNTLYSYDIAGQSWTAITPLGVAPLPLKGHSGVYDEGINRWVFFGGQSYYQLSGDTIALDATTSAETWETWTPVADAPEPRVGHATAHDELGGFMYLVGGEGYYDLYNDVWALDLTVTSAADWIELSPTGSIPAMVGATASYEPTYNNLYVIGGQEYYQLSDSIYCLDINTLSWTTATVTGDSIPPMLDAASTWSNYLGGILVQGGQGYYQLYDQMYFLAPMGNCSLEVTEVLINGDPVPPMRSASFVMDTVNGMPYLLGGQGYYELYDTVIGF
ncbi:MAG: Ig-like domain-containing protein [Myxococcota bacterium]|nr:Ig-like domain-containing protein [Myxococcota bacterium]